MAFKVGSTTVANNTAKVAWSIVSSIPSNGFVNVVSTSYVSGSGNSFPVNLTLLNNTLTISYVGRSS